MLGWCVSIGRIKIKFQLLFHTRKSFGMNEEQTKSKFFQLISFHCSFDCFWQKFHFDLVFTFGNINARCWLVLKICCWLKNYDWYFIFVVVVLL